MMRFLLYLGVVSATFEVSLPSLIAACRVTRGYTIEDRNVLMSRLDTSVDSIPNLPQQVTHAIKSSMMAAFDVALILRALKMIYAQLFVIRNERASASHQFMKKMRRTIDMIPTNIPLILNQVIDHHRVLPNWNKPIEDRVNLLLSALPDKLNRVCRYTEEVVYSQKGCKLAAASAINANEIPAMILNLLNDQVQNLVTTHMEGITPLQLLETSTYLRSVSQVALRINFASWRWHHSLYMRSLVAMTDPLCKLTNQRKLRLARLEQSSSVMKDLTTYLCYPLSDLQLHRLAIPHNTAALHWIEEKDSECTRITDELSRAVKELGSLSIPIAAGRGNSNDFETLKVFCKSTLNLAFKQEADFAKARLLRHEYVSIMSQLSPPS